MFSANTNESYVKQIIYTCNGTSISSSDVQIQESPSYKIYVIDYPNFRICQYNQTLQYLTSTSYGKNLNVRYGCAIPGGNFYLTTYLSKTSIWQYNSSLVYLNSSTITSSNVGLPTGVRYWSIMDKIYIVDNSTNYINEFSPSLQIWRSISSSHSYLTSIGFYRNPISGTRYLYAVSLVYNRLIQYTEFQLTRTFSGICSSTSLNDIYVDQTSGLILLSCTNDNAIRLWLTNGTSLINENKSLNVTLPLGISYDSNGRLFVSSGAQGQVIIFHPNDHSDCVGTCL